MSPHETDPITRLKRTGERLHGRLRADLLALGDAAVAPLIAVLQDEALADADSPHGGWPPIHAVDLLVDLNAADAIEPLLDQLAATDWDEIIHDRIQLRLADLGAPVLEPALARLPDDVEDELYSALCSVLAQLDVEDPRIFSALCKLFDFDQVLGSIALADYGDPRAVPLLEAAIRDFEPDLESDMPPDLIDLVDSYELLAGPLPDDLQEQSDAALAAWQAARAARERPAVSTKVGRNEPCPCGSGKKYKRCCQVGEGG